MNNPNGRVPFALHTANWLCILLFAWSLYLALAYRPSEHAPDAVLLLIQAYVFGVVAVYFVRQPLFGLRSLAKRLYRAAVLSAMAALSMLVSAILSGTQALDYRLLAAHAQGAQAELHWNNAAGSTFEQAAMALVIGLIFASAAVDLLKAWGRQKARDDLLTKSRAPTR
jgi:hypothetical protein